MRRSGQHRRVLRPGAIETLFARRMERRSLRQPDRLLPLRPGFRPADARLGRGSLIHVGVRSPAARQAQSGAYSVSKAGVIMLSRQLASDGDRGASGATSSVPALVITPDEPVLLHTPGSPSGAPRSSPCGGNSVCRKTSPDAILFLASDRSSYDQRATRSRSMAAMPIC